MGSAELEIPCAGPDATRRVARRIADALRGGLVIALYGDLGAGKTTFVRALAEALGVTDPVTSPTYTLLHEYAGGRLPVLHFDAWMEGRERAFLEGGGAEWLGGDAVSVVEWADRVADWLPEPRLEVRIELAAVPETRVLRVRAVGGGGPQGVLEALARSRGN